MVAHSQNPLIVITNGNYFARLILDGILNDYAAHVAGVLVVTGDYKGRAGLHAIWELSRVTAWPYILYKLVIYVVFGIAERIYPHAALSVRQERQEPASAQDQRDRGGAAGESRLADVRKTTTRR